LLVDVLRDTTRVCCTQAGDSAIGDGSKDPWIGNMHSMPFHPRVLDDRPAADLESYREAGGFDALRAAREVPPDTIMAEVDAAGLRGRGGAGFPTGRKWRTVAANCSPVDRSTVVVNAAEGEPGSFKDRALLRANPYRVLEGALIAAHAVNADTVIVAMKASFERELARMRVVVDEARESDLLGEVAVTLFDGPSEYLFGDETALLEAIDGRPPFPRIAPPYRHGFDELVDSPSDADGDSSSAAQVELAGPTSDSVAPPALVNNCETLANVPGIISEGADWFRSLGTRDSPGTVVCTVTGDVRRHGVAEFPMGTPLREVIDDVGGGVPPGRRINAVLTGVSNALLPASALDTPISFETMATAHSGLGTAGFIVFDDAADLAAVAAGVARFLAVESCGQCAPCKRDGLALADLLARVSRSDTATRVDRIPSHLATIADGARCNLAAQQQAVIGSILDLFPDVVQNHVSGGLDPIEPFLIVPIADIVDGRAELDTRELAKQPDWSFDAIDSGTWPADRFDAHRIAR
jgi:NADH-quinone oxidoreductase subunit F